MDTAFARSQRKVPSNATQSSAEGKRKESEFSAKNAGNTQGVVYIRCSCEYVYIKTTIRAITFRVRTQTPAGGPEPTVSITRH